MRLGCVIGVCLLLASCGSDDSTGTSAGSGGNSLGGGSGDAGVIDAAAGGSAASGGEVGVDGSASCGLTPSALAAIDKYRALYDGAYAEKASSLDEMAASGDGETYYTFQYVLDSTLSIYEATGDSKYLKRALGWAKTIIEKATIIDAAGYANWSGAWCDTKDFGGGDAGSVCPYTTISYQLDDFQGSTELARLARIVLLDPASDPADVQIAAAVRAFVLRNIVEKWGPNGRGSIQYLIANAEDTTRVLSDKPMLLGRILLELEAISAALGALPGESDSTPWLDAFAESFVSRLAPFDPANAQSCASSGDCSTAPGNAVCAEKPATSPPSEPSALTWDLGLGDSTCKAMDTSHANRYPYFASELAHRGRILQPAHIIGLARLFTGVLYNGNSDDPRVRNFIDGSQCTYLGRGPDNLGLIYSGWVVLAEWDDQAFAAADAVLAAIVAGKCNPTLGYNGTVYGRMELPAHLAKAIRSKQCPT